MTNLAGKNVVVGISGGIAAYKSIELIRLLRKAQVEVRVVLTGCRDTFCCPSDFAGDFRSPCCLLVIRSISRTRPWGILNWRNGQI